MHIRYGFNLACEFPAPTPALFLLHLRPELAPRLVRGGKLHVDPDVPREDFLDSYGNCCTRLIAPAGVLELSSCGVIWDNGEPAIVVPPAEVHPVSELPTEVLPYLLPSRYCDLEHLGSLAWSLTNFSGTGWARVQAISDWVHGYVRFDYGQARPTRTAYETFRERTGVCRDFTHLAISLCRCLNIPARYVTGYLGDIRVPADPAPMDFSAWMEVYLGHAGHVFDVRHNIRRIGHLPMAHGRDAADVALTTTFGPHVLRHFQVITEELDPLAASAAA